MINLHSNHKLVDHHSINHYVDKTLQAINKTSLFGNNFTEKVNIEQNKNENYKKIKAEINLLTQQVSQISNLLTTINLKTH